MRPKFTPQQAAAIEARDVSIALSAGAGCGKTFVLTQRFLSYLRPAEDPASLHSVVAITFTERAAREMRDRIRAECRAELVRCADGDAAYWQEMLRGLDAARISTIHSFCTALLRGHAVQAALDPGFGQLDAQAADTLLHSAVREALRDMLGRREPSAVLLVTELGLEKTYETLRALVPQRFRADFGRFTDFTEAQLAADWLSRWQSECVPLLLDELVTCGETQRLIELLERHEPPHAEMQRRREVLLQGLPQLSAASDVEQALDALHAAAQVKGAGTAKSWGDADLFEQYKTCFEPLRARIKKVKDLLDVDHECVEEATRLGLVAARMTVAAAAAYEKLKTAAGMLDFDDLLLRTRDLLRDNPEVRNRAASGIRFLMVDEFQDTDPVQADIVRMLCGERLLHGKLFLVGDAKQSIYRFRRADPRVFHALRDELPDAGRLPLSMNFRSQPEILKFVNCLFQTSMGASYEPLIPFAEEQLSPTPAIEFLFSTPPADAETKPNAEMKRMQEAEWIALRIKSLLADETPRIRCRDEQTNGWKLRRARLGDVVILFRGLTSVAMYEEALRKQGVDYYLVGGRAFFAQQEIFDLVNLCQYLDDPDDAVSLAGVLRSPFFSLTDDALFALADDSWSLHAALQSPPPDSLDEEQQRQIAYAAQVLGELRMKKDSLPLAELLQLALERTGYDAALLNEFLGNRKLANLQKLIEMARQFDQAGLFTLKEFAVQLREAVATEAQEELAATHPESSDVVRLMTIHQSKGLEFPVVILADMDWQPRPGNTGPCFHPQLGPLLHLPRLDGESRKNLGFQMLNLEERPQDAAETERLLYVAATRAADYLILSACLDDVERPKSPWLKQLSQRFSLLDGTPTLEPLTGRMTLGDVSPSGIPEIYVHHKPPQVAKNAAGKKPRLLPLTEFASALHAAEPAALPAMLGAVQVARVPRSQFSVTRIALADAESRVSQHQQLLQEDSRREESRNGNDETFTLPGKASEHATALGTAVHSVLERLDFTVESFPQSLLNSALMAEPADTAAAVRADAAACIEHFLNSPLRGRLGSAEKCFRELEFFLPRASAHHSEGLVIHGIIDALYQSADGQWHIVDYKTGAHAGQLSDAEIIEQYEIQLGLYGLAVCDILGEPPADASLVLLRNGFRPVTLAWDAARMAELASRVDAAVALLTADA